jgi:hypothetical protein
MGAAFCDGDSGAMMLTDFYVVVATEPGWRGRAVPGTGIVQSRARTLARAWDHLAAARAAFAGRHPLRTYRIETRREHTRYRRGGAG